MSRWPGKQVIGLTGNIATGKSLVRKMLERLGAFGIDADGLAHQAIARGAPAYAPVVEAFGNWILAADGRIDRAKVGQIVFSDAEALARLEAIVHPVVSQAVDLLVSRASQPVIVIEAIKLLEAGLAPACDAVWVVTAPEEQQLARLVKNRELTADAARQRMAAQSPSAEKEAKATHILDNGGSLENTWAQVQRAWAQTVARPAEPAPTPVAAAIPEGKLTIRRWKPADAPAMAAFIAQVSDGAYTPSPGDLLAGFRDYLIADVNGRLAGLAGWQVENLVTRVDELFVANAMPAEQVLPPLIAAVEDASRELQSEAALLFARKRAADDTGQALAGSGYGLTTIEALTVSAWREAAKETQPPDTVLLFKRLREDRVLRPV